MMRWISPFIAMLLLAMVTVGAIGPAQEVTGTKKTYTYKTVEKCKIQAEVYRVNGERIQPVIIWIHGVPHELVTVQDAGHGLAGVKPAVVEEIHSRVLAFLNKYMQ